jgi:hypothetical protein
VEMEVRIYRERQGSTPFVERLWRHIKGIAPPA